MKYLCMWVFKYGVCKYPDQLFWILEGKGNDEIVYESGRILWSKGEKAIWWRMETESDYNKAV